MWHHVLLDCAYQGFASGDAEKDAFAIRKFLNDGHSLLLSQARYLVITPMATRSSSRRRVT